MGQVKTIPKGYHTVTPYLTVAGADKLVAFIEQVFGGSEVGRHDRPDGAIMHAEVRIGDSLIMISEACEQMGPMPGALYVYVDEVDAVYRKLMEAGATSVMEPADMFWGDRFASVRDPWGNAWSIATHVEDVSPDELNRRARAFTEQVDQPG
ncbi:VOC family protein [Phycisphaerales bacterium AB-hyl4]|uniref:VOC family protein n=1 Tax=Natronomicrosphaera hydrolytica TaxID=3242702 RepID=A0ABV4U8J5_9BACT